MIGFAKNASGRDSRTKSNGSPTASFATNLQHVAGDVAELVELQSELFGVDSRATMRTLIVPVTLGIVGATVAATASLLGFAGAALWLHEARELSLPTAFLIVAAGAFVFGLACIGTGYLLVRWWGIPLSRSWHELKLNLAWTRRALLGAPGRSTNSST